ncbi:MAG: hypothetical protein ACRDID_00250, partial [Ktedonobacterales bacterium]
MAHPPLSGAPQTRQKRAAGSVVVWPFGQMRGGAGGGGAACIGGGGAYGCGAYGCGAYGCGAYG